MAREIAVPTENFDRTNAVIAAFVFVASFLVYALTVQRSFSFWDCGEFIACAYILGIPHPPGTPLFVLLGRVFSTIPFVEDISYRINYISVITSAFTAMFSYLLTVRLVGYFFPAEERGGLNRLIAYVGGIVGGLMVAWSRTNWGNSVEAEVYGAALALSTCIVWLTLRYYEQRGTRAATRTMVMAFYLAMLGIGAHMTVFLVMPVCAIFFSLKKNTTNRDWLMICGFMIVELLMVILFADGRGGIRLFYMVSAVLALVLLVFLYRKINWSILIAAGAVSSVMISFTLYEKVTPIALIVLLLLGLLAKLRGWTLEWRAGLLVLVIGFVGLSVHAFIPIRSALDPRIDENNPSRDWRTFQDFLDRKQYGQTSMVDRMFIRRGAWEHQFGRHPHMGFWSYFEEQYTQPRFFLPILALGIIGVVAAVRRRLQIGLPFLTLLLVTSVGLILYMNFADGTKYNAAMGDAYMEVRDRDYFFTPAFVFFGIAIGMGVSAVMAYLRDRFGSGSSDSARAVVVTSSVLVLLPLGALAHNYHVCDRSENFLPINYAKNLLDTCEQDAILFTSGDNDTFPVWCLQEVYKYRLDIRCVNLSLLNTDWYVEQMKNRYGVPISLTEDQILWYPTEVQPGIVIPRPKEPFFDRPRNRTAYLTASLYNGRQLGVANMMVDEIVLESAYLENDTAKLKYPIYFTAPPYAESPLKLRERVSSKGLLYKLDFQPPPRNIHVDEGYDLMMNRYNYDGYQDSRVYRDENATGVFVSVGVNATRIYDEYLRQGNRERAENVMTKMVNVYPEYWQAYLLLADLYEVDGDSARADSLWQQAFDTLTAFSASNAENLFYKQDLAMTMVQLGLRQGDDKMVAEGVDLIWEAFREDPNSTYAFRKLFTVLQRTGRYAEIPTAVNMHASYGINRSDPYVVQVLGPAPGATPYDEGW